MTAVDLMGWAGSVTGIVLGLPQLVHLLRTRDVEGLSLRAWQAMLAMNIGWTIHGILIGQLPQILTSALSLVATIPILYVMSRELRLNLLTTLVPGLLLAAAMIAVNLLWGSAAYGVFALIPAIIANAGQSVALVRAPHVGGVSVFFLIIAVVNQVFWLSWALLVPDPGTIIVASTIGTIAVFNLGWYTARRMGLRGFARPSVVDAIVE